MKISKPSDEDKEYFRPIVPDDPRVAVKPMFGPTQMRLRQIGSRSRTAVQPLPHPPQITYLTARYRAPTGVLDLAKCASEGR